MINESMKRKVNTQHLSCLWHMFIFSSLISANNFVFADPDPLSGEISSENLFDDTFNSLLLNRLKAAELKREIIEEERELAAQMGIQAMLEAKSRNHRVPSHPIPPEFGIEEPEMLPVPSPRVDPGPTNSGKRTSYMALCHFKICNMGRKRQL